MSEDQPKESLSIWARRKADPARHWVARLFVRMGISANALTVTGLVLAIISGYLAARGMFFWAALVLLFGGALDGLDGAVARESGKVTRLGALFDSSLDRYGESAILVGLMYYLSIQGDHLSILVAAAALIGSIMVSYVRARSEGLGIDNKVGLLTRLERVAIILLALLTGKIVIGLWIIAIGANYTVIQRLVEAARILKAEQES